MKALLDRMLKAARNFNVWDYGFFKLYLACFGIILGTYFSGFFMNYMTLIWVLFFISMVWIFYAIFMKYKY